MTCKTDRKAAKETFDSLILKNASLSSQLSRLARLHNEKVDELSAIKAQADKLLNPGNAAEYSACLDALLELIGELEGE